MVLNKHIRLFDNVDISEERRKATFDTDKLSAVIWENAQNVQYRRDIAKKVAQHKELHDATSTAFMDRDTLVDNAARKATEMVKVITELCDPTNPVQAFHTVSEILGIEGHPLSLHTVMFIPALQAQADDEQQGWWLSRAYAMEIIGTYAQTEMGHGTNLRKLETTATYDKATQEFVLHSPTTTSMKWWPGNLGKSANYAVVAATMIIDGQNIGPHNFFVQLRDENTHQPLPGVTVGDIGPKLAYNATDNGFLKFNNYRIPRRHMLARHAQVAPDGTYTKPKHAKIGYSAMVHVRSHMIAHQAIFLAHAMIIATRYSVVRKQGEMKEGAGEVKILEYQTQQHRLFPQLARAFAFMFAGQNARAVYLQVSKDITKGVVEMSHLADLHALTSGLKSVVTHLVGQGIEQGRMSCGGHGYSKASYFNEIYGVAIGGCTYEGENMVMLLQLARYLIKGVNLVRSNQQLPPLLQYLAVPSQKTSLIGTATNKDYSAHIAAFEHIARKQIFKAAERLEKLQKQGISKEDAWNQNAVEMTRAARLHTHVFIARTFYDKAATVADNATRQVLQELLHLYLNYELLALASYLTEDNYLSGQQLDWMKEDMYRLLEVIRPNAVSIVDSWDVSDRELRSVLGRRDGHVYTHLYKWAQESNLNKSEVLPSFEKYLKPMMDRGKERSKI